MRCISTGSRVRVRCTGQLGTVTSIREVLNDKPDLNTIGVTLDHSLLKLHWYKVEELELLEDSNEMNESNQKNQLKDYDRVAYVSIGTGPVIKSRCAVYVGIDVKEGDTVVISPGKNLGMKIARVDSIISADEYVAPYPIISEIIDVVDMTDYNARVQRREHEEQVALQKAKIESELKERLAALQTIDMYREMAEKYKDIDPEMARLVNKFDSLK